MTLNIEKLVSVAGACFLLIFAATDFAFARSSVDLSHPAFAAVGNSPTSIPVGHADFCRKHASECTINSATIDAQELTQNRWQQLLDINTKFNTAIVPVTDKDLYKTNEFWTYPNGYGDCEDYALAKRRALTQKGWNPSTLLIAVVRQENGEGHAVLMVRTDRGDLILDNQESLVKVWNETPYRFLKRQSQFNAGQWVDIYDHRPTFVASR